MHWTQTSGFGTGTMVTGCWISLAGCAFVSHYFIFLLSHFKVAIILESNPALLLSSYKVHQRFTFEKCLPLLVLLCRLPKSNPMPLYIYIINKISPLMHICYIVPFRSRPSSPKRERNKERKKGKEEIKNRRKK